MMDMETKKEVMDFQIEATKEKLKRMEEAFGKEAAEVAIWLGDYYLTIQEATEGYDYTFYDDNYDELDGGVYDNPDYSIWETLLDLLTDLVEERWKKVLENRAENEGWKILVTSKTMVITPVEYETLIERIEARNSYLAMDNGSVVDKFNERTKKFFHDINGMIAEEIYVRLWVYVLTKVEKLKWDVEVLDMVIVGSRCRGLETAHSDLDIILEYQGDVKEDVFFDILHEDELRFGDVLVDINPITKEKTGTIEIYLPTVEPYLKENWR